MNDFSDLILNIQFRKYIDFTPNLIGEILIFAEMDV